MGLSILIIDDDKMLRRLLRMIFENEGYTVVEARDGLDGLDKARRCRPNVVLLDVIMPKMNGFEVCKRLCCDPETAVLPIIMFGTVGSRDDADRELLSGVTAYINKPAPPSQLIEVIARAVLNEPVAVR